jgi:hypothetical protein
MIMIDESGWEESMDSTGMAHIYLAYQFILSTINTFCIGSLILFTEPLLVNVTRIFISNIVVTLVFVVCASLCSSST